MPQSRKAPTHYRESNEIDSWLDDEQMLAELGARCATLLAGFPSRSGHTLPPAQRTQLRSLLAGDWLAIPEPPT